jgi:hypothetical protein
MKKLLINKPGKYEINLSPSKRGKELKWLGIVDARKVGEYEVSLETRYVWKGGNKGCCGKWSKNNN